MIFLRQGKRQHSALRYKIPEEISEKAENKIFFNPNIGEHLKPCFMFTFRIGRNCMNIWNTMEKSKIYGDGGHSRNPLGCSGLSHSLNTVYAVRYAHPN
ncbi:MAG: hypothetical protein DRP81_08490 [Candidatus Omnitrophota bacterium]|nr:MAG: hypothetical protein DRP81_08490 [Candidatus Omnitrophota bacterium]